MLHKCKKVETIVRKFWRLIPTFVGVTAEKLVGGGGGGGAGLLGGGGETNLFKTFIKVRHTSSGKTSSGKSFRWGQFLSPSPNFP